MLRYESGYFADFLRFLWARPAALVVRFETEAEVRRLARETEARLRVRVRLAERRCDARVEPFTFAATVPSVEPIERATVVRKSSLFAAGLRSIIFMGSP